MDLKAAQAESATIPVPPPEDETDGAPVRILGLAVPATLRHPKWVHTAETAASVAKTAPPPAPAPSVAAAEPVTPPVAIAPRGWSRETNVLLAAALVTVIIALLSLRS